MAIAPAPESLECAQFPTGRAPTVTRPLFLVPSLRACLLVAGLGLAPGALHAADLSGADPAATSAPAVKAPPAPAESGWQMTASAYVWAAGLDGTMRTLPPLPATDVSIGFDDVLRNLDGAIMGAGEAQNGRMLLFFDLMASRVSPSQTLTPGPFTGTVTAESSALIGLVAGGYRFVDAPGWTLDGFAGVRGFAMKNTLTLETAGPSARLSETQEWVDGVIGTRLKIDLTPQLYLSGIAFAGAGGSDYEWDLYGGVGYRFNDSWTALAGYRAMKVDYSNGGFLYDALQQGPLIGVSYRF